MKNFDEVVSLGYNCEISFRLENCFGKINSWPFSWSFVLDRNLFLDALLHMDQIFQDSVSICQDSRVNSMVQCNKYKICFHPRSEYVGNDGQIIEEKFFPEGKEELESRFSYLVKKFNHLLKDKGKKTLLICGIENDKCNDTIDFIKKLDETINKLFRYSDYVLLVVLPSCKYEDELKQYETDNLKIRKIRSFGIQKCNDISTDTNGWGKIFWEFFGIKTTLNYYRRLSVHRIIRVYVAIKKRLK